MSDLQWLGLIVVVAYLMSAIWSRMHFIARSSIEALLGRLAEIEATARMRGAKDEDQIIKLLKETVRYVEQGNKRSSRLFSTGAIENRGWITAHYCELLLLSLPGYNKEYLYGLLRRESAELSHLPPNVAKAWRGLIDRHLDEAGVKKASSDASQAEADLSQLLSRSHRHSDAYHNSLAELYNKSVWLIVTGLLFVGALIVASPDAVPLLGAGAIGGLASRILRISTASSMPTDYGALWVPLFLSPVLGALLGWAGILLLSLGRDINLISLSDIRLDDEKSASVLALALLFGFTERFFNGVANLVADKVSGAASTAQAAPAQAVPPPETGTPQEVVVAPDGQVVVEEVVAQTEVVGEKVVVAEKEVVAEGLVVAKETIVTETTVVPEQEVPVAGETVVPEGALVPEEEVVADKTGGLEDKDK